jgi:hypothetical protein
MVVVRTYIKPLEILVTSQLQKASTAKRIEKEKSRNLFRLNPSTEVPRLRRIPSNSGTVWLWRRAVNQCLGCTQQLTQITAPRSLRRNPDWLVQGQRGEPLVRHSRPFMDSVLDRRNPSMGLVLLSLKIYTWDRTDGLGNEAIYWEAKFGERKFLERKQHHLISSLL